MIMRVPSNGFFCDSLSPVNGQPVPATGALLCSALTQTSWQYGGTELFLAKNRK
jgi:hypothetical protein